MKVLVCGSRNFNDYALLKETLDVYGISEIIHGGARGADTLAGKYGKENNLILHVFPADWAQYGKRAGPLRNAQMLREGSPEMVIAFLAPDSKGTRNMISISEKAGVPVVVVNV